MCMILLGGWDGAPGGRFLWGYCFVKEVNPASDYRDQGSQTQWACAPGKRYYGRGPIQLSYNYNYGQAGVALGLGLELLKNPDLVETDPVISFKTALWFWMTTQWPKLSCHDVIIGNWTPTLADQAAGRVPGYDVITNIINGGLECGRGPDSRVEDRIQGSIRGTIVMKYLMLAPVTTLTATTRRHSEPDSLLDSM
ncbi:Basic endochitinase C [Camellia lanceoleosa]|uniref:Basic endochitinase C n=1 Tax=Camellia lanceoleosa TaxID=1840588 RepID=A0ACC0IFF3_9ERIC|nr:Basic endochitinase C [Camellia lanceoleosa]